MDKVAWGIVVLVDLLIYSALIGANALLAPVIIIIFFGIIALFILCLRN